MHTAIVYGAQGSGKSRHAKEIAAQIGCTAVVDELTAAAPIVKGALHMTNDPLPAVLEAVQRSGQRVRLLNAINAKALLTMTPADCRRLVWSAF